MRPFSDSDSSFQQIIADQDIPIKNSLTSSTAMAAQKVKNLLTNSMFVLEGYTSKLSEMILQPKPPQDIDFFVLGQQLPDRAATQAKFKRTVWFTYRNNFPGLLNNSQVSDTGWGCMIRVGQMFLAEMLRRYQYRNYKQENISNILTAFLDDDESKNDSINYSIQKIVKVGHQEFKLQPGTWLTPSHISYILDQIHNSMPLRGYQNQKLMVFNNNTIFYQQILNEMGYKMCTCQKELLKCKICHKPPANKTSLVVILLSRVGLETPQQQYRRIVMDLLEFPQSVGIIGGKPNKALYFIGRQGLDKFIYLDPHYVQESTSRKNMDSLKQTFFCNSYRTIEYKSIDPSIGFGFYLHDLDDLVDFFNNLMRISKYYQEDFFIYAELKIPYYVKKQLIQQKKESNRKKLRMSNIFDSSQKNEKAFQI